MGERVAGAARPAEALPRGPAGVAAPDGEEALGPERPGIGRAALTITAWNLVSRITGFARVIATGAALGILALGDTYQRANETSNLLFELLAGGVLSSVLIPTFVVHLGGRSPERARAVGSVLLGRSLAVLAVVTVAGIAAAPLIMTGLSAGVRGPSRGEQLRLGAVLLWFFMPQLLLYATGAVATALLQAAHRFTASAAAPVANNVFAIATMVAFALIHDPKTGLALPTGEILLLGGGTLAGTVAMTLVPWSDLHRAGLSIRPRWRHDQATGLRDLARKGLWGAGHIGLNEVLIGATIVLAGRVVGGTIAFQIAFTFFLLPHAVLAHPVFTALYPRLSAHAAAGDLGAYARDVSLGLRTMVVLLLPASALLAVVAMPLLQVVRLGAVDDRGARLVAVVLAAYATGLVGYSTFFMLTRASYALDDVRTPTFVNLGVTLAAVAGMAAASASVTGRGKVVVLGLVHAVAVSAGALALGRSVARRAGVRIPFAGSAARALVATAVGAGLAWVVARAVGWGTRVEAATAVAAAGAAGAGAYVVCLMLMRAPELAPARARVRRARQARSQSP